MRDVAECAVAVVPQQRRPDRIRKPGAPRDEEIHAAVVVVVGLDAGLASELVRQPGRLGAVLEGAVARVAVEGHVLGGVKSGHREIEQSVVVEIFHDRTAGHVEAIDAHEVADVSELADVELVT